MIKSQIYKIIILKFNKYLHGMFQKCSYTKILQNFYNCYKILYTTTPYINSRNINLMLQKKKRKLTLFTLKYL